MPPSSPFWGREMNMLISTIICVFCLAAAANANNNGTIIVHAQSGNNVTLCANGTIVGNNGTNFGYNGTQICGGNGTNIINGTSKSNESFIVQAQAESVQTTVHATTVQTTNAPTTVQTTIPTTTVQTTIPTTVQTTAGTTPTPTPTGTNTFSRVRLQPLAYDVLSPNNGSRVSTLTIVQGFIVVLQTSRKAGNTLGNWQYKPVNGTWQDFEVVNNRRTVDVFSLWTSNSATQVNAFAIKSDSLIRFNLTGDVLWKMPMALKYASLMYVVKTGNTTFTEGSVADFTIEKLKHYAVISTLIQERNDCNNKPSSDARIDLCNVCGGNGKTCLKCDGVRNSNATYDSCGACVSGYTGKVAGDLTDCAGTCNRFEIGACGACQPKTQSKKIDFRDCNSDCFGNAREDACGVCAGGNSTKLPNADKDACGVCSGNNSTCTGCDNVLHSGKIIDLCQECHHPNSSWFNRNCTSISGFSPAISQSDVKLTIRGAGFNNATICRLQKGPSTFILLITAFNQRLQELQARNQNVSSGIYNVTCSIKGTSIQAANKVRVVRYRPPTMSFYGPKDVEYLPGQDVTIGIRGSNFPDAAGRLFCGLLKDAKTNANKPSHRRVLKINDANFVNSSFIQCTFNMTGQIRYGRTHLFVMAFTGTDLSKVPQNDNRIRYIGKVDFFAPPPVLNSAKMENDLRSVKLTFDRVFGLASGKKCDDILMPASKGKFTKQVKVKSLKMYTKMRQMDRKYDAKLDTINKNAKQFFVSRPVGCKWKGKDLYIMVTSDSTIKPGDEIQLAANVIVTKFAGKSRLSVATNVTLNNPDILPKPKVKIMAPRMVGKCSKLYISARFSSGGGGKPLNFIWTAAFDPSIDTSLLIADHTTKLDALKNYLAALTNKRHSFSLNKNYLEPFEDPLYKINVEVENFLGQKQNKSVVIGRKSDGQVPEVGIIGEAEKSVKSSIKNTIYIYAKFSSCATRVKGTKLKFKWEVDDHTVVLSEKAKAKKNLRINKNILKPGNTYIFTVTVELKNNPAVFNTAIKTLTVAESPLRAYIRGGRKRVVGSGAPFKLDASRSMDPDGSSDPEVFEWACQTKAGKACTNSNDDGRILHIGNLKKVTFTAGDLAAGDYIMTLTYTKGTRSVSRSMDIKVKAGTPPVVSILDQRRQKENSDRRVVVKGIVKSTTRDVQITWGCVVSDTTGYVDLNEAGILYTQPSVTRKRAGYHRVYMVFKPDVLDTGTTYEFNLTATSANGVSDATTQITTNGPPTIGVLEADVTNGTAMATPFIITASSGWEDDEDDLPLTYKFGYFVPGTEKRRSLSVPSTNSEITVKLPPGDPSNDYILDVFVVVSDIHRARSEQTLELTVNPAVVSSAAIENVAADMDEIFASEDLGGALASVASTIGSFGGSSDADVKATMKEFKENVTRQILLMAGDLEDKETQNVLLESFSEITSDGGIQDTSIKKDMTDKIRTMIEYQNNPNNKRRKRRSADETEILGKSVAEVETVLKTFDNLIDLTAYDADSLLMKADYMATITSLLKSMCQQISVGEAPAIATSSLVYLQSYLPAFEDIYNTSMLLGSGVAGSAAAAELGQDLEDAYSTWSCNSDDEKCNGACIGSIQFPNDSYSQNASSALSNALTPFSTVKLFNPSTFAEISVTDDGDYDMVVSLPLSDQSTLDNGFKCKNWNAAGTIWEDSFCQTTPSTVTISAVKHAECKCRGPSTITVEHVVQVPTVFVPTTTVPVTTAANVTANVTVAPTVWVGNATVGNATVGNATDGNATDGAGAAAAPTVWISTTTVPTTTVPTTTVPTTTVPTTTVPTTTVPTTTVPTTTVPTTTVPTTTAPTTTVPTTTAPTTTAPTTTAPTTTAPTTTAPTATTAPTTVGTTTAGTTTAAPTTRGTTTGATTTKRAPTTHCATCPVNGWWSEWAGWSPCSNSGSKTRERTCSSPMPANGGDTCPGLKLGDQSCVNGNWASWGAWATCSSAGTRSRSRSCSDPLPNNGGSSCSGSGFSAEDCIGDAKFEATVKTTTPTATIAPITSKPSAAIIATSTPITLMATFLATLVAKWIV